MGIRKEKPEALIGAVFVTRVLFSHEAKARAAGEDSARLHHVVVIEANAAGFIAVPLSSLEPKKTEHAWEIRSRQERRRAGLSRLDEKRTWAKLEEQVVFDWGNSAILNPQGPRPQDRPVADSRQAGWISPAEMDRIHAAIRAVRARETAEGRKIIRRTMMPRDDVPRPAPKAMNIRRAAELRHQVEAARRPPGAVARSPEQDPSLSEREQRLARARAGAAAAPRLLALQGGQVRPGATKAAGPVAPKREPVVPKGEPGAPKKRTGPGGGPGFRDE